MAKIPFDIVHRPHIESGEYEVVTDTGEPVEIVKWDCKGECPILAVIDEGDIHNSCFYHANGFSYAEKESICIITPEPELTEFEEKLGSIIIPGWDIKKYCEEYRGDVDDIKKWSKELLDIARKQFEPEIEQAYKNADEVQYRRGYEKGKADTFNNVPKWKKMPDGIQGNAEGRDIYLVNYGDGYIRPSSCLGGGDALYLEISELDKLPKEK